MRLKSAVQQNWVISRKLTSLLWAKRQKCVGQSSRPAPPTANQEEGLPMKTAGNTILSTGGGRNRRGSGQPLPRPWQHRDRRTPADGKVGEGDCRSAAHARLGQGRGVCRELVTYFPSVNVLFNNAGNDLSLRGNGRHSTTIDAG